MQPCWRNTLPIWAVHDKQPDSKLRRAGPGHAQLDDRAPHRLEAERRHLRAVLGGMVEGVVAVLARKDIVLVAAFDDVGLWVVGRKRYFG